MCDVRNHHDDTHGQRHFILFLAKTAAYRDRGICSQSSSNHKEATTDIKATGARTVEKEGMRGSNRQSDRRHRKQ